MEVLNLFEGLVEFPEVHFSVGKLGVYKDQTHVFIWDNQPTTDEQEVSQNIDVLEFEWA